MEFGSWDTIKRLLGDAKIDNKAVDGLTGTPDSLSYITQAIQEISGAAVIGRAVTAVLCVSPNGSGTDGASWTTAYQTIQAALNAASTDANECTLILVGINTGPTNFYDIDTTGDPTWTGNYIIMGTHRTWAKIKNNHTSATSVMKFTGYTSLIDLNINKLVKFNKESIINQLDFTKEIDNIKLWANYANKVDYLVVPNVFEE